MLTFVSVYNDAAKMEARLRAGLARQGAPHQLIAVDNRAGRFPGAAAALNHGAAQASGNWIVFLHQDVELLGSDWLQRAEAFLRQLDPDGWHGVVGRDHRGRMRGLLRDRDMIFGDAFSEPLEVQTLDEAVLIHRNCGSGYAYFDEGLTGWHAYGVEACCRALRAGGRNSVLPLPVWHDSAQTNIAGLQQAYAYVWAKHASAFRRIYTTCDVLPHPYGWSRSHRISTLWRRVRDWWHFDWMRETGRDRFKCTPWQVLEELTAAEPTVHCYHRPFFTELLEGVGFADRARTRRQVIHSFTGLPRPQEVTGCIVIAPDLAPDIRQSWLPPLDTRRLLVASYLVGSRSPGSWRRTLERNFRCYLAAENDGTRWAIMDVDMQSGSETAKNQVHASVS